MAPANDSFPTDDHGWAELLPARRASAPLRQNRRVPWTVVGAGLTGLSCARRLAELHPQDEILLLEARLPLLFGFGCWPRGGAHLVH